MKLDLNAVQIKYGNLVWSAVNRYLLEADNCERDRAHDAIFDKLAKGNLQKADERAVKAFVWKTTRSVCLDYVRKAKAHPLNWLKTKKAKDRIVYPRRGKNPPGRPPKKLYHDGRRTISRPSFHEIENYLTERGLDDMKHLKLLSAWCEDLTVKEIARRFKLTPMQVKGRLAYLRKKIHSSLIEAKK
jgi:DNA-directed RNA polymerase specialized sigma24 family protein